jgi:hypothetical protein
MGGMEEAGPISLAIGCLSVGSFGPGGAAVWAGSRAAPKGRRLPAHNSGAPGAARAAPWK